MMDDHFDESLKVMGAADAVARRSNNAALLAQVQKQDKQIKEVAKDHADMKAATGRSSRMRTSMRVPEAPDEYVPCTSGENELP